MYKTLVPCPTCNRHVLAAEPACPFCAAALPTNLADSAIPSAPMRLSRAAAFVFGASVAIAGCSSDETGGGSGGSTGGGSNQGSTNASSSTGPADDGGVMALYGVPSDGGPDDDGGGMAEYGAPADAG
jgi:hypothetical protein